jgi:aminobenzoyl-glutamate utilization protein B
MAIADQISGAVDDRSTEFTALSDQLWDHPELRWNEFESVAAQITVAERAGFRIQRQVAGIPTAFCAEYGTGGPVIAVLGEYDSLAGLSQESGAAVQRPDPANTSGNGQGCGHNLLGTGSLLAAVAVARFLDNNSLPGRVRYYGCPAEEAAAGKSYMVKGGAFADVDAAVSWHPAPMTGVLAHNVLAYCQAYFSFAGVAGHAGAAPWLGRSALDAAELMNVGVNFLREHMPLDCRIHYAFTDAGGLSPNVVQPTASLYYIVRAPDVPQMRALYERVIKVAQGAALMTETTLTVEFDGGTSELLPNTVLELAMQDIMLGLGPVPFDDADRSRAQPFIAAMSPAEVAGIKQMTGISDLGSAPLHQGIVRFDATAPRQRFGGSTDVGDVSWVVPTVQCTTATSALGTGIHAWQMVAQGKLPAAHKGMIHAAKIMGSTVAGLLTDDSLLAKAKDEFNARISERPYDCPIPDGVLAPPLRGQGSAG